MLILLYEVLGEFVKMYCLSAQFPTYHVQPAKPARKQKQPDVAAIVRKDEQQKLRRKVRYTGQLIMDFTNRYCRNK